jgi:hypothetical protein
MRVNTVNEHLFGREPGRILDRFLDGAHVLRRQLAQVVGNHTQAQLSVAQYKATAAQRPVHLPREPYTIGKTVQMNGLSRCDVDRADVAK